MKNENQPAISRERRKWYYLVQGLTFFRAMCGVASVIAAGQGNYPLSMGFFALGLATDLEGSIARAKNVATLMGGLRDLIADDCLYIGGLVAPIMIKLSQEISKMNDIPGIVSVAFSFMNAVFLPMIAIDETEKTFAIWRRQA